jgi:predicted polyphosphate/ATP-dependent NAD kinase
MNVSLLLFAGGDGTARDICDAVADRLPALGVPAGVKIHSAVFGTTPASAGDLAALFLQGRVSQLYEAEVVDIDEEAFRHGRVEPRLYGYLRVPFERRQLQRPKTASGPSEEAAMAAIGRAIVDDMEKDCFYVLGPGTTMRAVASALGIGKTLLGVDAALNGSLVAADVNEAQLLRLLRGARAKIVVTPIGGQGYLFGRGNQQISHRVIASVGRDNIIVVSTTAKIYALCGRPFLVDSGDPAIDRMLTGYISVVTGYGERMIYRITC